MSLNQSTLTAIWGQYLTHVNKVVANPDGMSFAKDATKPIGGNIIAHARYYRNGHHQCFQLYP